MDTITILKITAFLLWINFLPPMAKIVFRDRFCWPLDRGRLWMDGHPLFGPNKTIRGVLFSLIGGAAVFLVISVPLWVAGTAALLAMAGDLLTSFIKRRPNIPSGKNIAILDQIFEGSFPAIFLGHYLSLPLLQILIIISLFVSTAYLGSVIWVNITYRPSHKNYPHIIRSTARPREWRARHPPLARWQYLVNFSNFIAHRVFMIWFFKQVGLYARGIQNSLNVKLEEQSFYFSTLPESFDKFRILFLTDLHLDGLDGLTESIIDKIKDIQVDLCIMGGDIRMEVYGSIIPSIRHLRNLVSHIQSKHGIVGILGNHDSIEMVPDLEETGIFMLINDSKPIEVNGHRLWIVGVDDPHYYKMHDTKRAFRQVSDNDFKIFVAHSPEAYLEAADFNSDLYLCGHTHGGQICFPGLKPIYTNSRAPRNTASGRWEQEKMLGYTCRGAGASGIPLRFNCPGEISIITLHKAD